MKNKNFFQKKEEIFCSQKSLNFSISSKNTDLKERQGQNIKFTDSQFSSKSLVRGLTNSFQRSLTFEKLLEAESKNCQILKS